MNNTIKIHAKTWIQISQLIIFSLFGIFSIIMGLYILITHMKKVNGESADDAILPLLIIGFLFCLAALMAFSQYMAYRKPIITADENLLILTKVGGDISGIIKYFPRGIQFLYLLISRKGFNSTIYCAPLKLVNKIVVTGFNGLQRLEFHGQFKEMQSNKIFITISFADAELLNNPSSVCSTLNTFINKIKSAQQVDAPEPATMISFASQHHIGRPGDL